MALSSFSARERVAVRVTDRRRRHRRDHRDVARLLLPTAAGEERRADLVGIALVPSEEPDVTTKLPVVANEERVRARPHVGVEARRVVALRLAQRTRDVE